MSIFAVSYIRRCRIRIRIRARDVAPFLPLAGVAAFAHEIEREVFKDLEDCPSGHRDIIFDGLDLASPLQEISSQ
jgi:hypothetical protein